MTKDEFISRWCYFGKDDDLKRLSQIFISDLDDLLAWQKRELWDAFQKRIEEEKP